MPEVVSDSTRIDFEILLANLSELRPVFHSEADFQHELAILLRTKWPQLQIRLEVPAMPKMTVDVIAIDPIQGVKFALELKYKTANWTGLVKGEKFNLKNHGADDLGGYDVLKDVERIERLVDEGIVNFGAVILLTNEPLYWRPRRAGAKVTNAHEFRIHEGLSISGQRSWGPQTGGSSRGRENPVQLTGNYLTCWNAYSQLDGPRGEIRSIVFHVNSES